jgi:hypothetical protein
VDAAYDGSRGVSMAKQRRRRRDKRKRPSLILIMALIVLAAGFLTRRILAPRAMHFLTHRSASPPERTPHTLVGQPQPAAGGADENLTASDRRALDELLRQRSGR